MMVLLPPLVVPLLLIAGWLAALRLPGVPRWIFFGCCAFLPVLCVVVGVLVGDAEERALPSGCRDGTIVGLECGFGIGRFAADLAAFTGTVTLALVAITSLIVWRVRSHTYRGLPALTPDQ